MTVLPMPVKKESGLKGIRIPPGDNTSEALAQLQRANAKLRLREWPEPFCDTTHQLNIGDARNLSWIADESVHLVVTSPPYWTLKE